MKVDKDERWLQMRLSVSVRFATKTKHYKSVLIMKESCHTAAE